MIPWLKYEQEQRRIGEEKRKRMKRRTDERGEGKKERMMTW
jgi:hypothetical protein